MRPLIVTYDLVSQNKDYEALHRKIQEYPCSIRISQSCWVISSNNECAKIYKNLKAVIQDGDRLFVAELIGDANWSNPISDEVFSEISLELIFKLL